MNAPPNKIFAPKYRVPKISKIYPKIRKCLDLLGHADKVDTFYFGIDILVQTSDCEPFKRILIEGMAVDEVLGVLEDKLSVYSVATDDIKA